MHRTPGARRRSGLLLFLVPFLLLFPVFSSAGRAADEAALLWFKESVSDPSGLLSRWSDATALNPCGWPGVTCDARSRVISLNISGRGSDDSFLCSSRSGPLQRTCSDPTTRLTGQLSPAVGLLTELRMLYLPFHNFSGEFPTSIWRLPKLEVLDLEGNSISGLLPPSFPPSLRVLNLASNRIYGEIPSSLTSCVHLEVVDLSRNLVGGKIPAILGGLPRLRELRLAFNFLRGSIPGELGDSCGKLEQLDLSGNLLARSIPGSLANCSELRYLLLHSNRLEGPIPRAIGRLGKLQVLDVSRNRLRGFIPTELGSCMELSVVVLSNPYNLFRFGGNPTNRHGDDSNFFLGGIPESITSLPMLRVVWAPRSTSGGRMPRNWGSCWRLEVVNLGQNLLTGEIPSIFVQCKNLKYLNLSSNRLSGPLNGGLPVPCLDVFDVSKNRLSGSIPMFTADSCPSSIIINRDLASSYSSFFAHMIPSRSIFTLFGSGGSIVVHSFRLNKFTDGPPSLPVASSRLKKVTNYAFLADGNNLTEPLPRILSTLFHKCNDINGLAINISNNFIFGEIPANMAGMCKNLKFLDVAGNRITGKVPQDIGFLSSIIGLDLSRNMLQGQIPDSFHQLKSLMYFSLAGNNLTSEIPDALHHLYSVKVLDLSSNSFSASDMQRRGLLSPPGSSTKHGFSSIEIASVTSAAAIFSILLALIVLYVYSRKCVRRPAVETSERREVTVFIDIGVPITYENVVRAAGGFNGSNCIGSGGFGATYKAEIAPGVLVAIKRLAVGRLQGLQQFHAEIKTLGRWRHPNLVTLIGYHISEAETFLIYNYLPGGNLERFIKEKSNKNIDWRLLHKIALDVAQALAYLHDQCQPRILHRDVKPSNILLDNDFKAYLSDFGLARLLGNSETHVTTGVAGTFGYVAPEYAMTCRVSDKADVYSYGVVLMELLSDKKALDPSFSQYGNGFNIVAWALMLLRQGQGREFFTKGIWEIAPHDDLIDTLHLAVKCTADSLSVRPTMKQVVQRLKQLRPPIQISKPESMR